MLVAAVMCVVLCLAVGIALADVSYGVIGGVGLAKFIGEDADGVEPLDFGLVFGGGVEVDRFLFDLRYSLGLADLSETTSRFRNSMLSLMVGYRLR